MPARSYSVDFEGYWTDVNSLPTAAGIYCAYACIDNQDTVSLSKLLYIGETDDIRGIQGRVKNHEKKRSGKDNSAGMKCCVLMPQPLRFFNRVVTGLG